MSKEHRTPTSAADLRAEIARQQIPLYKLAAEVNLHPSKLGQMLNERIPLSPEISDRVREAVDRSSRRGGS